MTQSWAERLGKALHLPPAMLMFPPLMLPIRGFVGAGAAVHFADEELPDGYEEVPAPPGATTDTTALEVRGASMPGVAEDGWNIYYDQRVSGVPDDYIGDLCVVWLADGNSFIKRVYRGKDAGSYDLVSTGIEPIRDVMVESSAKVSWIRPR